MWTNNIIQTVPDTRFRSIKLPLLPGIALLLTLTASAAAQENQTLGRMWTFENPPLAYLEEEYGFKPDQAWLDSLRLGSLRLGGEDILSGFGSASFVSPNGLILTSTRCIPDAIQWFRPRNLDSIEKTGFVAAALEQEIRLRSRRGNTGLTAAQLVKISNVTDQVNEGVTPTDDEARVKAKREANKQTILDAARKADPKLLPQIVSLYQGAVVQLYQYRVFDDIRLVCTPHLQSAHFGRDADNFTYPRRSIDFAFLRAYENGKPANTIEHYFKWKSGGAKKGELVFVSGNPGTTKRLFTKAQLEFERDIKIPLHMQWFSSSLRIKREFDIFNEVPSHTPPIGMSNGLKAMRGNLNGLHDAKLTARKTAAEEAFKRRVMADEKLAKKYGDLWDRIADLVKERRLHEARARFHATGGLSPLNSAITIVRSCDPAETADHRQQARREIESWGKGLGAGIPAFIMRFAFVDHVVRAHSWLPMNDPFFSKVLGGMSGEEFLKAVVGEDNAGHLAGPPLRTLVYYPERRNALVKSGWKGIQDCKDPAIVAARELVILMRKNEKLGAELDAREEVLGAEIGRAWLACYGTNVSSDGTMTPRFTDGVIGGFASNGTVAPYRTTFYGLYARNAEFDNEYPFNLPKIWLDRKDKIDMTKPVNFVSTNDVTRGNTALQTRSSDGLHWWQYAGGNAGSVVVNKALEVVGVVVDGNIESLNNDFVFSDDVPRAVSVHVDGIMEALVKIYEAHRVADELTGKPALQQAGEAGVVKKMPLQKEGTRTLETDLTILEADDNRTDEALFADLLDSHWERIFPNGERNVGGPQFFKYIYEQLATSHDLFQRYNRFYCGVSGAIVRPSDQERYDLVKIKDNEGRCVVGKYYRCCWPCSCDVMKHARVEQAVIRLPNDPGGQEKTYWVLTIGDPCYRCASSPCPDLPPEVTTYACKDNVTSNGLRVSEGQLTSGKSGRLVFALLHDAAPADEIDEAVTADLMTRCTPRINASPEALKAMGGMGNIFVDVARVNSDETLTNSLDDLCE